MTKTKTKLDLINQISSSVAVRLLIPAYQDALINLAKSGKLALKKALEAILRQENPDNPQTIEFTEITLEGFVERNFPLFYQRRKKSNRQIPTRSQRNRFAQIH